MGHGRAFNERKKKATGTQWYAKKAYILLHKK